MTERKSAGYLGKALLIEIRPIPMSMAVLAALFGACLGYVAFGIKYNTLVVHIVNVAVILYSAHLVDTYNDLKNREEYQRGYKRRFLLDDHDPSRVITLNPRHYLYAMACTYPVALVLSGILMHETGSTYGLLAIIGLVLSAAYGCGLDRVFLIGDIAWEFGVILAFVGGFYVNALTVTPEILVMVFLLMPILFGAKILDAEPDIDVDRKAFPVKNSVPVKLGLKNSHRLAYAAIIIPVIILLFMVPAISPTLIAPLLIALVLVIASYPYPAEKGVYFVATGIILFLCWAILAIILS
jgi:hypothetical protein